MSKDGVVAAMFAWAAVIILLCVIGSALSKCQ
jgi:hypothetical protein